MNTGHTGDEDTEVQEQIEDCMRGCDCLTDWEVCFIDKMALLIDTGQGLTQAQRNKLEQIWQKVLDEGSDQRWRP